MKSILKNFSYSLTANLFSLVVSVTGVLILPKYLDINEYGKWQLYVFYLTYVVYLHCGWIDGIYLRFPGNNFYKIYHSNVNYQLLLGSIAYWLLFLYLWVIKHIFYEDNIKFTIFLLAYISGFFAIVATFSNVVFQIGNKIQTYAKIILCEKLMYCSFLICFIILGLRSFENIFFANLLAILVNFFISLFLLKVLLLTKKNKNISTIKEFFFNINTGINILFSNLIAVVILGMIRFITSMIWNIEDFAKLSLLLSLLNFVLVAVNAINVVLYPIITQYSGNILKMRNFYEIVDKASTIIFFFICILFIPVKLQLENFLPQYADILQYFYFLIPISFVELKSGVIYTVFLKGIREEVKILRANFSVFIVALLVIPLVFYFNFKIEKILIILFLLLLSKCLLLKIYLDRLLEIRVHRIFFEIILIISFSFLIFEFENYQIVILFSILFISYCVFLKNTLLYKNM